MNPNADYYDKIAATAPAPISVTGLNEPEKPLHVPDAPIPRDYSGLTSANLDSLLSAYNEPTAAETQTSETQQRILNAIESLGGKTARKTELETQAGLPQQRKDLQDVVNQLQGLQKEALAIPLQIQKEAEGRGVTAAGVAPHQTARLRDNAIKSLQLSAIGQTLQGNISLAESNIKSVLAAEFEVEQTKLDTLKQVYEFNKDALARADAKKTFAINTYLKERERILEAEKYEREATYNIGLEAARNGATTSEVDDIFKSSSREEALGKASTFLSAEFRSNLAQRDFQNRVTLRNLEINEQQLKLAQDKASYEKEQREFDTKNGVLDEKELKDVDNSPQGKKVKSLGDVLLKAINYKSLVDEYGTASVGSQKARLEAAYSDLKIAYKTAAELGAIQAPDVPIIEGALNSATFANPISQIFSKIGGGGRVQTITAGLDTAIGLIQKSGKDNLTQLLARNPKYSNSAYVQSLSLPFMNTKPKAVVIGGQEVPVGTVIENAAGQRGRVEPDGTITPL